MQSHKDLAQLAVSQLPRQKGCMGQSEKEKMLSGELYSPSCRELQGEREKCKDALYTYNYTRKPNTNLEECVRDLRSLLDPVAGLSSVRIGKGVHVDSPFRCDYGYNISIGNNVVIEANCFISDPREVVIRDETYIGPNVTIIGHIQAYELGSRRDGVNGKARGIKIIIGKSVHVGAGCLISPSAEHLHNGVLEIGDDAYIMPGSVIVKVYPTHCVTLPIYRSHTNICYRMCLRIKSLDKGLLRCLMQSKTSQE